MTTATQKVQTIVATPLADLGILVSDIELAGGLLRVTVERADGTSIDIDAITEATRIVSRELDVHDPIPGHYTLEVSSPGLERPCAPRRTSSARWASRSRCARIPESKASVASTGLLTSADDDGIVITTSTKDGPVARTLALRRHRAGAHRLRVGSAAQGAKSEEHRAEGAQGHSAAQV